MMLTHSVKHGGKTYTHSGKQNGFIDPQWKTKQTVQVVVENKIIPTWVVVEKKTG